MRFRRVVTSHFGGHVKPLHKYVCFGVALHINGKHALELNFFGLLWHRFFPILRSLIVR